MKDSAQRADALKINKKYGKDPATLRDDIERFSDDFSSIKESLDMFEESLDMF